VRAAGLVTLLLTLASVATGQDGLPPRDPVPLRRDIPPPVLPDIPPGPPPVRPADDPLFPPRRPDPPAADLPPRLGRPLDDFREPPPFRGDGDDGTNWPQRRNPERDDEYSPRYRVWYFGDQAVRGQPTDLSQVRQELDVPIPILLDRTDLFGASLRVRNITTYTRAVLPDSGQLFPKSLWEVSLGIGYLHRFDNGWSAGILPRIGTISDKPFESTRELNLSAIAFVRAPAFYEGDFWNFTLFYFPNSQVPFPIPGVAYEWNPNPDLRINIGLPFNVRWRFAPDWQFDFGYRPLTQITSRLSWEPRPGFKPYAGFDWDNEGYYLVGRPNRRDLFFLQEKRLTGGVRFDLSQRLTLDLSGGYAFDRSNGVGRTSVSYRSDRLTIESGGFLSAWLLLQF